MLGVCSLLLAAAPTLAAPEVITVSAPSNPGALQSAIDGAADGDVIRVEAGSYYPCRVQNKSLRIHVVDPAARVYQLLVAHLDADQSFTFTGPADPPTTINSSSLQIVDCQGPVFVSNLLTVTTTFEGGSPALQIYDSDAVVLHNITVAGGLDCYYAGPCAGVLPAYISGSTVALYDCEMEGADGQNDGPGASALSVHQSDVLLQGCRLVAGSGQGGGSCNDWLFSGAGGSGLFARGGSHVSLVDCQLEAGLPGSTLLAQNCPEANGRALYLHSGSTVDLQSRFEVELTMPNFVPESTEVTVEMEGTPSHPILLLVGSSQLFTTLDGIEGALLLSGRNGSAGRILVGASPATWTLTAPDLLPGSSTTFWFQPVQLRPGKTVLGHVQPLTVFGM